MLLAAALANLYSTQETAVPSYGSVDASMVVVVALVAVSAARLQSVGSGCLCHEGTVRRTRQSLSPAPSHRGSAASHSRALRGREACCALLSRRCASHLLEDTRRVDYLEFPSCFQSALSQSSSAAFQLLSQVGSHSRRLQEASRSWCWNSGPGYTEMERIQTSSVESVADPIL